MPRGAADGNPSLRTRGTELVRLPSHVDVRGSLVWGQVESHLPFKPLRFWFVHGVPTGESRGNHAHSDMHELMICVHGSCAISLDDGVARDEIVLDKPDLGLHLPPLTWSTQHRFSPDAVLLVLADQVYRPESYLRDYDAFRALVARRSAP
ncbi:MAG TPA: FdtA/QdtA family cupin domain-containing protein [Casimicrobiaceae bacterium]|nr:FdtA/QdtA family cupin domain-containing protein [Casimicrobiaceae bacterium]